MPFLDSAKAEMKKMKKNSPGREILHYLLRNAVGRMNAKSWGTIETHLKSKKMAHKQTEFQQGLLKFSRSGDIFIGSTDRGSPRGYFLIKDIEDARTAREFYARRIKAQSANLRNLDKLISLKWP